MEDFLIVVLYGLVLCVWLWTMFAGKSTEQTDTRAKKVTWLSLAFFVAALALPAAGMNREIVSGAAMAVLAAGFFWVFPITFPSFANYIVLTLVVRLLSGKTAPMGWAVFALILMLGSLIFDMNFGWGFLAWLVSACYLIAACALAEKRAGNWLMRMTVLVVVLCVLLIGWGWTQGVLMSESWLMFRGIGFHNL